MKLISILFLFFSINSQEKIWIKVNSGTALYLDPYSAKWIPINGREEVPLKTYLIVKENSSVELYRETNVLKIDKAVYFFISDSFVSNQFEILSNLARIEANQFPAIKGDESKRKLGLIYGSNAKQSKEYTDIPNYVERKQGVEFFIESNHYAPALLSQKRMMSKFSQLYSDIEQLNRLFILYEYHGLTEYVFEETKRMKEHRYSNDIEQLINRYHENARLKLSKN